MLMQNSEGVRGGMLESAGIQGENGEEKGLQGERPRVRVKRQDSR